MALQLNVGSLTSGSDIDVQGTVDQLMSLQKAPLTRMQQQQQLLALETSALTSIQTKLQSLEDAVQALGSYTGSMAARTATSSQPSAVNATATSAATVSQHQISVDHIATTSSWYSKAFASNATFTAGSFSLKLGSNSAVIINVAQGDSLQTIAKSINGKNAGVTANVISDANGSRLTLIGNSTGAANEISVSADTVGLQFLESASAKNASFTMDGVQIDSATNSISTIIPGLTLTLMSATNSTATLNVQADTSRAKQAITNFVNAYNSAVSAINAQFTYDPTTKSAGPLAGDPALRTVQEILLGSLSYSLKDNNGITTLVSLGVNMQDDGTLMIDSGMLDSAFAGNFTAVQNFFQSTTPKGFCSTLNASLQSMLDSTNGAVTVDLKGISNRDRAIVDQIDDLQDRLDSQEQLLLRQFEQVDALLRSYPTTMDQISAILGSLPSTKSSSK